MKPQPARLAEPLLIWLPPLIAPGPHLAGLASLVSALPSLSLFGPSPSHESLDILSVNLVLYKFKMNGLGLARPSSLMSPCSLHRLAGSPVTGPGVQAARPSASEVRPSLRLFSRCLLVQDHFLASQAVTRLGLNICNMTASTFREGRMSRQGPGMPAGREARQALRTRRVVAACTIPFASIPGEPACVCLAPTINLCFLCSLII